MAPKRLLLFGGTFDPPHNGHMALLSNAISRVRPDKTLVLPDYLPPHKAEGELPPGERLAMCRCFLELDGSVELDGREVRRQGKSYTVDTVRELKKEYPGWRFYFVLGSDMLLTFDEWREWKQLLRAMTLVCQRRENGHDEALQKKAAFLRENGGRILFCGGPPVVLSSTFLRGQLKQGADISALVPQTVARRLAGDKEPL